MFKVKLLIAITLLAAAAYFATASANEAVYQDNCAECHGADRLGGIGPALLPGNLKRLRQKSAIKVITDGREATQMPAFGEDISQADIASIVEMIYTPLGYTPAWDISEINETHVVHNAVETLPAKPQWDTDPLNLFTVVETGDHHVTILDGDAMEPLARFPTRFALHGGAKYSPDGRFVYLASRDGWVSKYDLYSFKIVAETRVGINTRNIAVSSDGLWVAAGNFLPHSIVILNAKDLSLDRVIPVADKDGNSSRVSAIYNAPPRNSFIAALKDVKEVWELSYDPEAGPVREGFAHNNRAGEEEGFVVEENPFGRRRIQLDDYLDDFFFDPYYAEVIGASRDGKGGAVYNLDGRKKIATFNLDGMPHLGSGIYWEYEGRLVMATPHLKGGSVSVIDMESWDTVKQLKTKGPGFFMRSHENTPYAWVDVFFGDYKDVLHVIDKRTLKIVKTINPAPGKTNAHVEFTRDGKYALVSVWDNDGALVVYDSNTLKEVKRIPMKKPVGKYNVYNKITYSAGTSH